MSESYITYSSNLPGEGLECRYCVTQEDMVTESGADCFNDGPLNACATTSNECYESALYVTLIPNQGTHYTKYSLV